MSADDFDAAFGARAPSFTERLGKSSPPPAQSAAGGESQKEDGVYKPYGFLPSGNIGETCDVQRWIDGTEMAEGVEFQYRFLMQIGYVGEEQIRLFLPDCIVLIEGVNLRDLRKKLARRQVTFISQYSPRVWPLRPPTDTSADRKHCGHSPIVLPPAEAPRT